MERLFHNKKVIGRWHQFVKPWVITVKSGEFGCAKKDEISMCSGPYLRNELCDKTCVLKNM